MHFAGSNRKSQGWNIICNSLSLCMSHYLQNQWAEISFFSPSSRHWWYFFLEEHCSVFIFLCQKHEDITKSSFSVCYTWRNDLHLYSHMILAIIILVSFNELLGGKSKSVGLKWQQCPQNEHYCHIKVTFLNHQIYIYKHRKCVSLTNLIIYSWFHIKYFYIYILCFIWNT